VSGGQTLTGSTKKFLCYDPLLDNWEERSPMLQMTMNHSMAEVQNNLYVIGGNVEDNYGFPVPVIAIEKYCPVANQWTLCQRSLNIREAGVCVIDQKIYMLVVLMVNITCQR
jgi:kelch-like protein 9/13